MISGYAIATLTLFIASICFVIAPVNIPILHTKYHIPIDLRTAPILAIAILWAAQCLGANEIRDGIVGQDGIKPYNILILFFSLAYMAITLDITGVLEAAAQWVANKGGRNGRKLYLYFYMLLALVSVIVGNDPVILSGTEFLLYYTDTVHIERLAWLMAEFVVANTASMVLFVGNPTNVVICEGFGINNIIFSAYTIFPFLGCLFIGLLALAVQFRHEKYIPKLLERHEYVDPRARLRDSIGAIVGSSILGACLLVIIIVSFFNVDVWKISLPFAVAKFLLDIIWDHYRYQRGKLPYKVAQDLVAEDQAFERKDNIKEKSDALNLRSGVTDMKVDNTNSASQPESKDQHTQSVGESADGPVFEAEKALAGTSTHDKDTRGPTTCKVGTPTISSDVSNHLKIRVWGLVESQKDRFHTVYTAFPRLPFSLIPFAFSQFILVQALEHQGWIEIFASWLSRVTGGRIYSTVWLVGVAGVLLCNISGTNIGATILMAKVINATPGFGAPTTRAAAISLAVATNIGAVSFTFSASLAGLLWRDIMHKKGYFGISQSKLAFWNLLPLLAMIVVSNAIVCIEMFVLYPGEHPYCHQERRFKFHGLRYPVADLSNQQSSFELI